LLQVAKLQSFDCSDTFANEKNPKDKKKKKKSKEEKEVPDVPPVPYFDLVS